jgi:hypothetical protein
VADHGRRGNPWKRFRAGRWYPAEYVDGVEDGIRLLDGSTAAVWPRQHVEIRGAPDDEWEVRSLSRTSDHRDGQAIEYPTRVAECPEGHMRAIPTRFDSAVVELRCADCRRTYRLASVG